MNKRNHFSSKATMRTKLATKKLLQKKKKKKPTFRFRFGSESSAAYLSVFRRTCSRLPVRTPDPVRVPRANRERPVSPTVSVSD